MAAGLPVIASGIPAHASLVRDGVTGNLCDSSESFASRIANAGGWRSQLSLWHGGSRSDGGSGNRHLGRLRKSLCADVSDNCWEPKPVTDATLIIGAGGFIGRHLVRTLAQQGHRVIAINRSLVDFKLPNVEMHIGELREPENYLPLVVRSRAVVHLASTSTPTSSAGQPLTELPGQSLPDPCTVTGSAEPPRNTTDLSVLGWQSLLGRQR